MSKETGLTPEYCGKRLPEQSELWEGKPSKPYLLRAFQPYSGCTKSFPKVLSAKRFQATKAMRAKRAVTVPLQPHFGFHWETGMFAPLSETCRKTVVTCRKCWDISVHFLPFLFHLHRLKKAHVSSTRAALDWLCRAPKESPNAQSTCHLERWSSRLARCHSWACWSVPWRHGGSQRAFLALAERKQIGDDFGVSLEGLRLPPPPRRISPSFPRNSSVTSPEFLSLWIWRPTQGFSGSFADFPTSSQKKFPGPPKRSAPIFFRSLTPSDDSQTLFLRKK